MYPIPAWRFFVKQDVPGHVLKDERVRPSLPYRFETRSGEEVDPSNINKDRVLILGFLDDDGGLDAVFSDSYGLIDRTRADWLQVEEKP